MAALITRNQSGAAVGDTFGTYRVHRVIADTNYVFVPDEASPLAIQEITADPAPAAEGSYVATYVAAGPFTLPALSTLNVGESIEFTNANGTAMTVTPQAGEILDGTADGTWHSDSAGQFIKVQKVSATEWAVGPNLVTVDIPDTDLLYDGVVGSGLVLANGLTWNNVVEQFATFDIDYTYNNGVDAYSQHVLTEDVVTNKTWRFGIDDPSRASMTIGDMATGTFICNGTGSGAKRVIVRGARRERSFQAGALVAEPARDLLMDVTGSTIVGETIPFLGGHTRTSIMADYERVEFWVFDMKQGGNNQRNDWPVTSMPVEALTPNAIGDGFVRIAEGLQGVHIADAGLGETALTFGGSNNDGLFSIKMWGVRKQFNAIRAEDAPVDDQAASGYVDIGTMRMQWGGGVGASAITFPAPFADTNYRITATGSSGLRMIRLHGRSTGGCANVEAQDFSGNFTSAQFDWIAVGLKP